MSPGATPGTQAGGRCHVAFPLRVTAQRRTELADDDGYLRALVETVIFTQPGERLNRPDFGSGIAQLVFAPASGEVAETTRALVLGALQRTLGDLLRVEEVAVDADEATLRVTIVYVPFVQGAAAPDRRTMTVVGGTAVPG